MSKHLRYEATNEQMVEISKTMKEDGSIRVKFYVGEGKVCEALITEMTDDPKENIKAVEAPITRAQKERLLRLLMDGRISQDNKVFIRGYLMKEGLTKKGASKVIWMALKDSRMLSYMKEDEELTVQE
jgi:hypothetical protein